MTEQNVIDRLKSQKKDAIDDINFFNGLLASASSELTGAQLEEIQIRKKKAILILENVNGEIEILEKSEKCEAKEC